MVLLWRKRCLVVHTVYSHASLWRLWTCDGVVKYTEGDGGSRPENSPAPRCTVVLCEKRTVPRPPCVRWRVITQKVPLTSSFGPRFYDPVHCRTAAASMCLDGRECERRGTGRDREASRQLGGDTLVAWHWLFLILFNTDQGKGGTPIYCHIIHHP